MINYFDNKVLFKLNEPFKNDTDFELFIEYIKLCYGETICHSYEKNFGTILIRFLFGSIKKKVLEQKVFNFLQYSMQSHEILDDDIHSGYHKYEHVFMIKRIRGDSCSDLIKSSRNNFHSLIYDNFLLVELTKESNPNSLSIQNENYEAFETASLLVKITSNNFNEDYLNRNFKVENCMYWQLPFDMDNSPFVIVRFLNTSFKIEFIVKYSKIKNKEYIAENNFNLNLLNDHLSKIDNGDR
jgi:hypothetical protein